MTLVMQEMLRCLDARLEVSAFAKTHRPEEQQKLDSKGKVMADVFDRNNQHRPVPEVIGI